MSDREKLEKRRKEHMEDLDLFSRFQKAAVDRLDAMANMAEDSDTSWKMGESERELVRQLTGAGVKEGLVGAVATFVLLRRGPILLSRYLHHRQTIRMQQQQQQMGNMGPTPTPPPTPPPPSSGSFQLSKPPNVGSANNPFQQSKLPTGAPQQQHQYEWKNPRPRSIVFRTAWFCVDVTMSLLAGASISIAYTDTDRIRRQIVEMPLLEGRSLVADAFCDSIELELNNIRREGHPAYQRLTKQRQQEQDEYSSSSASVLEVVPSAGRRYSRRGDDAVDIGGTPVGPYLQDILTAVEHCQRRRYVEHEIRMDHGWNKSHPVEIPPPGVPRNGPRLALENSEDASNESASSAPENWDNSSTTDFDDPTQFVTDQEEQMRNNGSNSEDSNKKGWW